MIFGFLSGYSWLDSSKNRWALRFCMSSASFTASHQVFFFFSLPLSHTQILTTSSCLTYTSLCSKLPCLFCCCCLVTSVVVVARLHLLLPARPLRPWDSPGKSTAVACHALLQGIFPTQGSNPGLPRCRWVLYCLSHQRRPCLFWVFPKNCLPRRRNKQWKKQRQVTKGEVEAACPWVFFVSLLFSLEMVERPGGSLSTFSCSCSYRKRGEGPIRWCGLVSE